MARTVAQVLTSAWVTLNDAEGVRYSSAELLGYVVDALNFVRNLRPDLFLGRFGVAFEAVTAGDPLAIDSQFFRPIVDYVIARAETKDAAHIEAARVQLMAGLAAGYLV